MVSLRNPGRHETDLLTWKEGLESDGFLVISVAVLMVMKVVKDNKLKIKSTHRLFRIILTPLTWRR